MKAISSMRHRLQAARSLRRVADLEDPLHGQLYDLGRALFGLALLGFVAVACIWAIVALERFGWSW